jgi:hypothetical protein
MTNESLLAEILSDGPSDSLPETLMREPSEPVEFEIGTVAYFAPSDEDDQKPVDMRLVVNTEGQVSIGLHMIDPEGRRHDIYLDRDVLKALICAAL